MGSNIAFTEVGNRRAQDEFFVGYATLPGRVACGRVTLNYSFSPLTWKLLFSLLPRRAAAQL